jgi:Protein of unknown function (DUF2442)
MDDVAHAELLSRLAEIEGLPDEEVVRSGASLPRAVAVEVVGPFRLRARYDDGRVAEADMEGLVHRSERFARLRDPAMLARVEIAHGGAALRFAGDEALEIGADLLLALEERQHAMSGAAFAAWLRRHGLTENAAADVLGLARRTVQGYKAAATVPPLVAVACRAFDTDATLLPALYRPRRPGRPRRDAVGPVAA